MKKIYLLLSILAFGFLFSCDKIENDEYLKEGSSVWYKRKIIVYDFTGHKCGNCPKGHRAINGLIEKYGEAVVPIAVHCSYYSNIQPNAAPHTTDTSFNYNFCCPEGIYLGGSDTGGSGYMDLETVPQGIVNSISKNKLNDSPNSWAADFAKYYSTYPEFMVTIAPSYADSTITANVKVETSIANNRKLGLVVYIVENNIIQWQLDYEATPSEIKEYEHNHVLRGSMNNVFGEIIKTNDTQLEVGNIIEKTYNKKIDANWNIHNCEIVAFVYDTETEEILQAEISRAITNEE